MNILILSCSLNPTSNSRVLALAAQTYLNQLDEVSNTLIDARALDIPDFDHESTYQSAGVQHLTDQLAKADSIIIATPVYNWGTSGVIKKIIENTGTDDTGRLVRAWEDKVVTFLCAAGVPQSYMAYLPLANSLMLDYKCMINPHITFAIEDDFSDGRISNPKIEQRLTRVLNIHLELTQLLKPRTILSKWEI